MTAEPYAGLTPRWTPMRPHPVQSAYWNSPARFNVVPAGRRSGKTEFTKRRLVRDAIAHDKEWPGAYGACAPTRAQAKRIFWRDLKSLVPTSLMDGRPSEADMTIRLVTGTTISVFGLDVPERVEGTPWDKLAIDEIANVKPKAWRENLRPALADRGGGADLIGVPEGRGPYYDMYADAKADATGEWAVYDWSAEDILPEAEIESLRRALDPQTFDQEVRGKFVDFQGGAYHAFSRAMHVAAPGALVYSPAAALVVMLDFNVEPGVAAVGQLFDLPDGTQFLGVLWEAWIRRNSNTPKVCAEVVAAYRDHRGPVWCYGDATGGARKTSATEGSDWELVERAFKAAWPGRVRLRVKSSNPTERARLNAVNSALHAGRVLIDPRCVRLVKDFEGVLLEEGGGGAIDKDKDRTLTHISDAVGYFIEYEWPVTNRTLLVEESR